MASSSPIPDVIEQGNAFPIGGPELAADPYPAMHLLRAADPVLRFEPLCGWLLSRYDDVVAVLRDSRFSSSPRLATVEKRNAARGRQPPPFARPSMDAFFGSSPLFADAPRHTRLRGLVNKGFTPRMVRELEPRIRSTVDRLIDGMLERGRVDFVRDFANPLPAIVIAELLGIPPEEHDQFREWSDGLVILFDPFPPPERRAEAFRCAAAMYDYFGELFARKRRKPGNDLVSVLVSLESDGDSLGEVELYGMCMLLLAAGHETTTNLLGNGLLALLEHPDELERLTRDPTLLRSAIEEMLRYDSPVQGMPRVPLEDIDFLCREFKTGDYVVLLVGAANRDPEQFPDPDRFDIGRRENKHLAFGHGAHFCLGAPLARAEATIAFETLLRRVKHMERADGELSWKPTLVMRGLEALPLNVR